jgi:hypothetical protein
MATGPWPSRPASTGSWIGVCWVVRQHWRLAAWTAPCADGGRQTASLGGFGVRGDRGRRPAGNELWHNDCRRDAEMLGGGHVDVAGGDIDRADLRRRRRATVARRGSHRGKPARCTVPGSDRRTTGSAVAELRSVVGQAVGRLRGWRRQHGAPARRRRRKTTSADGAAMAMAQSRWR